jgi:hypothetical protein
MYGHKSSDSTRLGNPSDNEHTISGWTLFRRNRTNGCRAEAAVRQTHPDIRHIYLEADSVKALGREEEIALPFEQA